MALSELGQRVSDGLGYLTSLKQDGKMGGSEYKKWFSVWQELLGDYLDTDEGIVDRVDRRPAEQLTLL